MLIIDIKNYDEWELDNDIDLMIVDPPNMDNSGWNYENYYNNMYSLLGCAKHYLVDNGILLIFADNTVESITISNAIADIGIFNVFNKLYWIHNDDNIVNDGSNEVIEIFCLSKSNKININEKCNTTHCLHEKQFSIINTKPDGFVDYNKYKNKFPYELVKILFDHFCNDGDRILDPLCGSGMVGVVATLSYPSINIMLGDNNSYSRAVFPHMVKLYSDGHKGILHDNKDL